MKIMGIRVSPNGTRYAVVDYDGTDFNLMNANDESRLQYPANVENTAQKLEWLHRELQRVLRDYKSIDQVCIKTNEYTQNDSKAKRESAHLEGAVMLLCQQNGIGVDLKIYASLGTKGSDVKDHAEKRVGRTLKYWDTKMADAVIAAWKRAKQ